MSKLAHSNQATMDEIEARRIMENPKDIEAEANEFAMCLLMPADWVQAEVAKVGGFDIEDDLAVRKLAIKFRVSPQVMTLRLGQVMGLAR